MKRYKRLFESKRDAKQSYIDKVNDENRTITSLSDKQQDALQELITWLENQKIK